MSPWLLVAGAGLLEVVWALTLKYSNGFTVLVPSLVTVVAALGSFWMLSVAMRDLPVGTAYAVWVGIGTAGTAILAMVLFGEPATLLRFGGLLLILGGIVALKLA